MKVFLEQMNSQSTPRKCSTCMTNPRMGRRAPMATYWLFRADKKGAKDKSSRMPVCESHAGSGQ